MFVYHLRNRNLYQVLPLLVKCQLFSKDLQTLMDLEIKARSFFYPAKRHESQLYLMYPPRKSLYHCVFFKKNLPPRTCERVKTERRHRVPTQEEERCGADATQENKIHMHFKLSNYCQMHE